MGFCASDEYSRKRQETLEQLVTPQGAASDLRALTLQHMKTLVNDHNERVHAKFHFLETGEVLREDIRELVPFIARTNPSAKHNAATRFFHEFVRLPADLDSLSDAGVLKAYGEVLLRLREIILPDPDPA